MVHLKNAYLDAPWPFDGAYLTRDFTSYTARPFALRMDRSEIAPGQSGRIAVVVDKRAFETEGGQLADLQVAVAMDHTLIRQ